MQAFSCHHLWMQSHDPMQPYEHHNADTQHANLSVLQQIVALDQVYQAQLKHIACTDNA